MAEAEPNQVAPTKRSGKSFPWQSMLLLVGIAVFMAARRMELLSHPRFWAEEGKIYFAEAFNSGFWSALTARHFGYFSLLPNVSGALATLPPLEAAPFVTTFTALALQLLVCSLVIFGTSIYWDTPGKKALVSFAIPLLAPGEVWLTTICTQYWLTAGTFIILLEQTRDAGTGRRWLHRSTLALSGLTSVGSCLLAPLFLLKSATTKEREDRLQTAILLAALALQLAVFAVSYLGGDSHLGARFGQNRFDFLKVVHLHLTNPLLGKSLFEARQVFEMDYGIASRLYTLLGDITYPIPRPSFVMAEIGSLVLFGYLLLHNLSRKNDRIIGLSFLLVSITSTILSVGMASSPRYAFAPTVMLVVLLLAEFLHRRERHFRKILAGCLLGMILMVQLYEYRWGMALFYSDTWPKWPEEVRQWRQHPGGTVRIWPQWSNGRWSVELAAPQTR